MTLRRSRPIPAAPRSAFVGFRFPPEIIVLALRWYLRYGLSYRDVEELLGERGIEVDHVTIYRWVQGPLGACLPLHSARTLVPVALADAPLTTYGFRAAVGAVFALGWRRRARRRTS
jgi:hypothetical protein